MTDVEFRAVLTELGHTQASFARLLVELGDTRPPRTIETSVSRMWRGVSRVSGEMQALLGALSQITLAKASPR